MAVSFEEFAAELRAFDGRREVVNALRRDLRKPLPKLRADVRANAIATLPSAGGLGAWVAAARFDIRFNDQGRNAGFRLKVGRKSRKGKSELDRLDTSGRLRHPLPGDRRQWFGQTVPRGFFSDVWDLHEWERIADEAFDRALDKIRNG